MPEPAAGILVQVMKEHGDSHGSNELSGYGRSEYGEGNFQAESLVDIHWKYRKDGVGNEEEAKVSVEYSFSLGYENECFDGN